MLLYNFVSGPLRQSYTKTVILFVMKLDLFCKAQIKIYLYVQGKLIHMVPAAYELEI